MNLSEIQCNDKLTEIILGRFVKLIEKFDGNWEQIYGYFNMGNWYNKKTYF